MSQNNNNSQIPGYPGNPPVAAPAGYPGPEVPLPPPPAQPVAQPPAQPMAQPVAQPMAQPPAQPTAQPPAQGHTTPAAPAQPQPAAFTSNLGAAIANATIGVERLPKLGVGDYLLRIDKTTKPSRTQALIAEFTVLESTSLETAVGARVSWYQNLSPRTADQAEAQYGACLALVMRAAGYSEMSEWQAVWPPENIASFIDSCLVEPGPLAGRSVRCSVTDSGKVTRPKQDGTGGGQPIMNYAWQVA